MAAVPLPDSTDIARCLPRFFASPRLKQAPRSTARLKASPSPLSAEETSHFFETDEGLIDAADELRELMGDVEIDHETFLAEGMPLGFGLEKDGEPCRYGALHHRLQVRGLARATQGFEPDLNDPEHVYSGCEPRHLPLNHAAQLH